MNVHCSEISTVRTFLHISTNNWDYWNSNEKRSTIKQKQEKYKFRNSVIRLEISNTRTDTGIHTATMTIDPMYLSGSVIFLVGSAAYLRGKVINWYHNTRLRPGSTPAPPGIPWLPPAPWKLVLGFFLNSSLAIIWHRLGNFTYLARLGTRHGPIPVHIAPYSAIPRLFPGSMKFFRLVLDFLEHLGNRASGQ